MIDCVPENERPGGARAGGAGSPLAALALSLGLAACASIEAPPRPTRRGGRAGAEGRLRRRRVRSASGLSTRSAASIARRRRKAYLNGVLVKLAQASDAAGQPYRVTLLNSPVVNAFALPSGDIFMTRGLSRSPTTRPRSPL